MPLSKFCEMSDIAGMFLLGKHSRLTIILILLVRTVESAHKAGILTTMIVSFRVTILLQCKSCSTTQKYGNKSFLPELRVIESGMLKGFVCVNPRWAGFKVNDYIQAAQSVYCVENSEG